MKCRMQKRCISLLLALAISFSASFINNTTTAYASTITQKDAITWAQSKLGQLLDFDHCYGAQCVDLITSYYDALGVQAVKGDARDYARNELPYGWERFNYYNGFEPHPGDIVVWSRTGSRCGHVAIVTSYANNTINIIEQCGRKRAVSYHSYPTSHGVLACFIRPNFSYSSDSRNTWLYDNLGWLNLNSDGSMARNCWRLDSQGWCYLNNDGRLVTNSWMLDSQGWCYIDSTGHALTNSWAKDSNGWCYMDENGRMASNKWALDSQGWCYLDSNGYMASERWAKDSYGWCYLDTNGRITNNAWRTDSQDWCYLDESGYMVDECWAKDSYDWCYLGTDGHLTRQDWVEYPKGESYMQQSGYITRHWMELNNEWYYFGDKGITQKGWAQIDGEKYYFDESGKMARNVFIDDNWVDSNGQYDPNVKPMAEIQ